MARGKGIVIQITGDPASAKAALEMVREQMVETAETAKETGGIIENAFERATRALEYVGIYAGIRELGDGLKEAVSGSLEYGEAMVQASQKTGLSVQTMSVLHYATSLLGEDFDGLVTGIARMQINLSKASTGNKQAAADFAAMGINAKELASKTDGAEIAYHKFVTAIANAKDIQTQNRLATDLMGRAGIAQIPVLIEIAQHWDELTERAQAAGVVLDGETAESLARVNQGLADMKAHIQGTEIQLTEGLAPALAQIAQAFAVGSESEQGFSDTGQAVGVIFKSVITVFDALALVVRNATDAVIGFGLEFKDIAEAAADAWKGKGNWVEAVKADLQQGVNDEKAAEDTQIANRERFVSQMKALWEDAIPKKALVPPAGPRTLPPADTTTKAHSANPFAEAAAALAAEQARAAADAQKDQDQIQLAELDAQHRMLLISDQDYYAEKFRLQMDEFDAEEKALRDRQTTLENLLKKQQGDKLLKRDKSGDSVEELKTERELLQVKEQLAAIDVRRGQASSANTAEVSAANQATELAGLRAAAELEKQRNDGITAQIALLERETQLEVQKAAAQGASGDTQAAIAANGQVLEQKLRIAEVDRQIQQTEETFSTKAKEIEDQASKNAITKLQAERQLNTLHQQEVAALQSLVEQYDALAATLGGPFKEKAQELHATLAELSTPDKSKEPQFGKTLTEGMTKMAETIARQSVLGKTSFHEMAKEMEADAAELALKLAMMKIFGGQGAGAGGGGGAEGGGGGFMGGLGTMLSGMFGALPHFAAGGSPSGPSVVGEQGPELWTPPAKGGTITPNSVLNKLSGGGVNRAPNVTTNVINQSSQPLTAQTTQTSYDSQLHEFITHVVLSDHASNGPIAQAMKG